MGIPLSVTARRVNRLVLLLSRLHLQPPLPRNLHNPNLSVHHHHLPCSPNQSLNYNPPPHPQQNLHLQSHHPSPIETLHPRNPRSPNSPPTTPNKSSTSASPSSPNSTPSPPEPG